MDSGTGSGSAPGKPGISGPWRLVAPAVIALLGIGTVLAFGYSQRLKREPLVIDRVELHSVAVGPGRPRSTIIKPGTGCPDQKMVIRFRTTRSDRADVEIIGPGRKPVRRLVRDKFFRRYREHRLIWNGTDDTGLIVPPGRYRIRVIMHGEDRELYLPGRIRVRDVHPGDRVCPVAQGGAAS